MFLPPGEIIHESLATSYVLVDALCADLCEGGFSGVVEVVLRDTDSFIVISNGIVSAAIEERSGHPAGDTSVAFIRTTVEGLAERSRRERGRVSIYGYPSATASAVAGRINAQPLYVGLSTEFTDLEKMIAKLVRERDREWFIEVAVENGLGALIHMRNHECRVISSTGRTDTGALDLASNSALGDVIEECNRSVGTFDVYFTQVSADTGKAPSESVSMPSPVVEDVALNEDPASGQLPSIDSSEEQSSNELSVAPDRELSQVVLDDEVEASPDHDDDNAESDSAMAAVASTQFVFATAPETESPAMQEDVISQPEDLSIVRDEFEMANADVDSMTEIKRLMGEIARAIEDAAQSVGRPDSFAMSLRAGQLQIADRYPFLDPFAGEFEYLAGEIVFVGQANAESFVEGLTAALKLAIDFVASSTAHSERFRSYVTEDLRKLHTRERAEFEKFDLEDVILQLIPS